MGKPVWTFCHLRTVTVAQSPEEHWLPVRPYNYKPCRPPPSLQAETRTATNAQYWLDRTYGASKKAPRFAGQAAFRWLTGHAHRLSVEGMTTLDWFAGLDR